MSYAKSFAVSGEVQRAMALGQPVVALETTVITHGLPHPQNLTLARDMEGEVRVQGAVPATIGVLEGVIHVGMEISQVKKLAGEENLHKISARDFAAVVAQKGSGGTTVAGTVFAANKVGLRVLATGGIGGVHRRSSSDISADLPQLTRTPVLVVCAGAKAILDLPATVEYLETAGVPVIGYQTDEFPAFYSRESGLPVSARAETPEEAAAIAQAHWEIGMPGAVLLVVPPPEEAALSPQKVNAFIEQAIQEADEKNIHGQAVTPYLLSRVSELTGGESLRTNLALLCNNARIAAQAAQHLTPDIPKGIA